MKQKNIVVNAGAVVLAKGKILLVKESYQPNRGKWNLPLGRMEPNEKITETALREVREETGYDIKLTGFLGVYQSLSYPKFNTILFVFKARVNGGELKSPSREILQARWFTYKECRELPDRELVHPEIKNMADRALEDNQPLDSYVEF